MDGVPGPKPLDDRAMENTEILIAGGGPVGLTVALELARFGVRAILINDGVETALHPKANAINARTMEHFRRHGLGPELRSAALPTDYPTDVCYVTRLTGQEIARLEMPSSSQAVTESKTGTSPYDCAEPPHRCSQVFLEPVLREAVVARPSIDVRFGQRLESFRLEGDGVVAVVRNLSDDTTYEISAQHLVGADGGKSTVRRQLGVRYQGEGGVERRMMGGSMMATLFRTKSREAWLTIDPAWQYWVIAADLRALLVSVDGADDYVLLTRIPEGTDPEAVDDLALLATAAGRPVEAEILLRQPWTAGHALLAEHFGKDRAWLVGDAAHLFTPTGGLGMNTGVDDGVNLAWKLAGDVQGWGGEHLLATYEEDRRPIGARNLSFARGFAESIGTFEVDPAIETDTDAGAAERERLGCHLADHGHQEFVIPGIALGVRYTESRLVSDDGSDPVPDDPHNYVPTAKPGHRAPHVWREDGSALCDHFANGFTLLRTNPDIDAGPLVSAARSAGLPLELLDVEDAAVRERYEAALVLIFPDGHIAWRGNAAPVDARGVIGRARGA